MPDLNDFIQNPHTVDESIDRIMSDLNGPSHEEWLREPTAEWLSAHNLTREKALLDIAEALKNPQNLWAVGYCSCLIPDVLNNVMGEPFVGDDFGHRPWCVEATSKPEVNVEELQAIAERLLDGCNPPCACCENCERGTEIWNLLP